MTRAEFLAQSMVSGRWKLDEAIHNADQLEALEAFDDGDDQGDDEALEELLAAIDAYDDHGDTVEGWKRILLARAAFQVEGEGEDS